ncbi:Ig-like domain-containing protein [Mesorhizobium retamae]|uniref:LysM peptidoglycan-binding domain-containing protein n=1 Tax=Mesorhizobium retamae TaxID=2912854 RepID=A0ABS9QHR6_9HYPH|nr:LysM peptidoglycan-binding domain-containing protein [Mesorhizobium sp. IRAMC:0171]MCG7506987.1 LysM peptidoglycan-binding domain-containing protein [Mesorhizobium sp. IRAMC:0171]
MTTTLVRALLFAGGGAAAVAGVAYVSGALDPYLKSNPPAQIAAVPPSAPAAQQPAVQQPAAEQPPAEQQAAVTPAPQKTAEPAPAVTGPIAPTFDVLRAESDGSVVVAGKAAPNAKVDVMQGATLFGSTTAGPDGDFAIVLDDPLKPGNYQLQLRSTSPSNTVVPSAQTAVVAIPEKPNGQVLALVEEPGKAATLLSVPKVEEKQGETGPKEAPPAPAGTQAAAPQATASAAQPAEPAAHPTPGAPKVAVGAVEIDGGKIFVAGTADPGSKVRAYANEILLGEAVATEKGQFLVEATRNLPVGDYTIRVDLLGADGSKVVARAAVPFQREPGEAVAAVAPSASDAPPAPQDTASAGTAPTAVAPKLEQVNHAVIIRRGDSLWRISRRVYGHGVRYSTIYLANQQQIRNPDRIWPGQVFKVPQKSKEGETADMKTLGDQATVAQ